jgi:hypothetical protein
MLERERAIVGGLLFLSALVVFGFFIHRDPLFPGSLAGGVLGVSAAALMLVPLVYLIIKRVPLFKRNVTKFVTMRTLLSVHIYAGVLAPILGILHSGHRFESALGIWLTALMLVVAFSGYAGRHLLQRLAATTRDNRDAAIELEQLFRRLPRELSAEPSRSMEAIRIADAIADTQIEADASAWLRGVFTRWLACHIIIALILYGLLALHVWTAWYFGIRWLT